MKTILLIILAIVGAIIVGSVTYVYSQMYDCLNPPLWMKIPRFGLEYCFELFLSGNLPEWTQAKEDYEKKQALRIKLTEQFKDKPEVVAFYSKYEDANVSVRDDHVSYFAGSEDGFFVRMNFYFDQNYELDYIDFHCYYQNEHQFEFPQEDIATKIARYDCQEHGKTVNPEPESSPEPEQIPLEERLHQEKQHQAKLQTQKEIMMDYRGDQHQIDAINKYRDEFEAGYFLEQFIVPNKQNFEKDDIINFIVVQWGYQPEKCLSYSIKAYFKPYENYDPFYAEKISEWENAQECGSVISSDSNGYIVVNMEPMPGIPEEHQTCINPGEYRILVRNLKDEPQVEWGHYTCQRDKLIGEPQPWMEIPE